MNKIRIYFCVFLAFVMVLSLFVMTGCITGDDESVGESVGESETNSTYDDVSEVDTVDTKAATLWKGEFANIGFESEENIFGSKYYMNGVEIDDYSTDPSTGDAKYLFRDSESTLVVNNAYGYSFVFPSRSITLDNSLSELRTKYSDDDSILTVSFENKNPYGNNENGWNTYLTEWLNRYVDSIDFLSANGIKRIRKAIDSTEIIPGYQVLQYDMELLISKEIERRYYNIAIIRKADVYDTFYLYVMKSKTNQIENFDIMVKSFKEITVVGKAQNMQGQYEMKIPETWSQSTKDYFEKWSNQKEVSWGAFSQTLIPKKDSQYRTKGLKIEEDLARIEGGWGRTYDIYPTYSGIGWGDSLTGFPLDMAFKYAGGDGFNGKPVLQYTYQFTLSNNTNMFGKNVNLNIMRGDYDEHFRSLAREIKEYGFPVLFRLNNEMNSDWTSYSGIVALLDPDIFVMNWERLYRIFQEEGVDNCIWIFNPIAKSCPFSNWGEALNYMPSQECVQALGLTDYEMNNGTAVNSFQTMYTGVYNSFKDYFDAFPWIISEFACGSGGEKFYDWGAKKFVDTVLGRNQPLQARWVREMFDCFEKSEEEGYEFVRKIKGAIWFSSNDYADIDGKSYIQNYLNLGAELTQTYAEFKAGLARTTTPKE